MPDILHDLPIEATPDEVFEAVSTPAGLNAWWTKRCSGAARLGAEYELWFGPEWDWRATVSRCVAGSEFELRISRADEDWTGTVVGFRLRREKAGTGVGFYHAGWSSANAHYRRSSYCWAMYLRVLKRYLEYGETVPYERRNIV